MEIIGKLTLILPEQRGESARGAWLRGGFVIETEEQFSRKIAFSIWGEDKYAALKAITIGTTIKVIFNIESREYNERWYTDCRCTQIETFNPAMPSNPYNTTAPNNNYTQSNTTPTPNPMQEQPVKQEQMPQQSANIGGGTIENDADMNSDDDLPF